MQRKLLGIVNVDFNTTVQLVRGKHRLRVFENRVLRRIFGPKWDELSVEWRRLHNGELYDLYCSPNIIWVIKPRTSKWVGNVTRMERGEMHTELWWEK
jgi:hypothetical protein